MNVMFSKVSSKCQTVIPREVREHLKLNAGDRLAYAVTEKGILMKKATQTIEEDPFELFSEWSSPVDDEAYNNLR